MRRALIILVAVLAGCGGSETGGERAALQAPAVATAPPQAPPSRSSHAATPPPRSSRPATPPSSSRPATPSSSSRPATPPSSSRPATPPPNSGRPAAGRWATARLTGRVALRASPGGRALGAIGPQTEFGGPRVVSVLRRRAGWLEVVVPERPNARPAWIAAGRARLGATDVSVLVDRSDRTLTVRRGARVALRITIGVGASDHPTPTGRFAVTDKLEMGGPGTTYGCCALALSAHQPNLPDTWNGLDRIAVHGTQSPETIGLAASLGCMHASERDLRRLMRTVPLGAPVFIRA